METAIGILGVLLLPVSLVFFILGLVNPSIFNKLFRGKANKTKNTLLSVFVLITGIVFISIAGYGSPLLAEAKTPTNQKNLTVNGSNAFKNSDIKIFNNGGVVKELKADGKGKFSVEVELKEGSNKLKSTSTNVKGRTQTSSELEVILDLTAPKLDIDQPKTPTDSDKFTLTGKSEKNAKVIVYSGDKELKKTQVEKESFEIKDIALNEGENKFTVKAVDEADNYSEDKEIIIVYVNPAVKAEAQKQADDAAAKKAADEAKAKQEAEAKAQADAKAKTTPAPATAPVSSETVSQKNAVAKAKSYLGYSAFSHDGLVAQLEYEQFSHADAVYGADNSGADWNEQAAKKAKSYMEYSAFSRGSLIAQLEYEKFTQAQAEYGANAVGI